MLQLDVAINVDQMFVSPSLVAHCFVKIKILSYEVPNHSKSFYSAYVCSAAEMK